MRSGFAYSREPAESAALSDPARSARLPAVVADARSNHLWGPLETVLAPLVVGLGGIRSC